MNRILDIHTHATNARNAIVNFRLTTDHVPCTLSGPYSIGIHPWDLTEENAGTLLTLLQEQLKHLRPTAIGEAGLDKLATAPLKVQETVFRQQIILSETYRLPLVIHCVRAMEEVLALKKELAPRQAWIWHGFRGKAEQARQLLQKGFHLSFGEHYQAESLKATPDGRLLLETDESCAGIEDLLRKAAEIRGVGEEPLRSMLEENVGRVFFRV